MSDPCVMTPLTAGQLIAILSQVDPDTIVELLTEYYDTTGNFVELCKGPAYEAYCNGNVVIIKD